LQVIFLFSSVFWQSMTGAFTNNAMQNLFVEIYGLAIKAVHGTSFNNQIGHSFMLFYQFALITLLVVLLAKLLSEEILHPLDSRSSRAIISLIVSCHLP
jgi:hypothetical protein